MSYYVYIATWENLVWSTLMVVMSLKDPFSRLSRLGWGLDIPIRETCSFAMKRWSKLKQSCSFTTFDGYDVMDIAGLKALTKILPHIWMSHFHVSPELDKSFSSLSRLGWEDLDRHDSAYPSGPHNFFPVAIKIHSFVIFKSPKTWIRLFPSLSRLGWVIFKSLETRMSHFQVSLAYVS